MSKTLLEERRVIVIGKTGAGKSNLLNKILALQNNAFRVSYSVESVTSQIETAQKTIEIKLNWGEEEEEEEENDDDDFDESIIKFKLIAYDTPGIADSKGRSKEILNQIANKIKSTLFNLIIILVDHGRMDTSLYNNLEILNECLNGLSQASTMIVINKVPTERMLASRRKKGEDVPDKDKELRKMFDEISKSLKNEFIYNIYLENDDYDECTDNELKYDMIRRILWESKSPFKATHVKTWDEILAFYEAQVKDLNELEIQKEVLLKNLENRLEKIEFDIADIKYPYLQTVNANHINLEDFRAKITSFFARLHDQDPVIFTRNFVCKLSEEDYESAKPYDVKYLKGLKNLSLQKASKDISNQKIILKRMIKPFMLPYQTLVYTKENYNIINRLKYLDAKRSVLKEDYEALNSKSQDLRAQIANFKNKICRLETCLTNSAQVNSLCSA